MKNTFTRTSTIILVCSLLFGACKKNHDKDNTPAQKTKTELISTGSWKFSAATYNGINAAPFLQACQKDNILTFTSTGNGTLDESTLKCNSVDPATSPFTWNFASNETILHVSSVLFTGGNNDFTILEISETTLKGSQVIEISGNPATVVVTFVHN